MDPFGIEFGKTIGQLVGQYRTTFAWVALIWHVATLALLYLIFRYGNRYRRLFAAYFVLNYAWLVAFVGLWMSVGLYQWYRELKNSRLDLDFIHFEKWRLLVAVPMLVWGFWYPPYIFGVRLVFDTWELLFGAYGLMGCPTTMVALSLLFLKYPAGNRTLFNLLTAYAVMVGAATVALLYVPAIPEPRR